MKAEEELGERAPSGGLRRWEEPGRLGELRSIGDRPTLGERFRLAIALLVAAAALSGTLVFAKTLRDRARQQSPHLPDAEVWIPREPVHLAEQVAQGRKFYARSCAECHADDASGDEGSDLRGLPFSNRRVAKIIRQGIKGEMPSFRKKYGDPEIQALIAFLRSLPSEE